jgi:hypothetical protein
MQELGSTFKHSFIPMYIPVGPGTSNVQVESTQAKNLRQPQATSSSNLKVFESE